MSTMEAFMSSIDAREQMVDRQGVGTSRLLGLSILLAEYRRAVAAEACYEQLRCRSFTLPRRDRACFTIARRIFDSFYSGKVSLRESGAAPTSLSRDDAA